MGVIREKYKKLSARSELLRDEVILAQAWKKTHSYIRRHNWYADVLELDCSALTLELLLKEWSEEIRERRYVPNRLRLVAAPKNGPWIFSAERNGGWGPKKDKPEEFVLRPLAHVGIREQTVATAIMLCLANCIETAQGDTSLDVEIAASRGVFSYGNRLYCHWKGNDDDLHRANFSWGNSDIYSQYFEDYQRFFERPNKVAESVALGTARTVYVIKLDLKAFYDNVDILRLVYCLQREYEHHRTNNEIGLLKSDDDFWKVALKALTFEWANEDIHLKSLLRDGALPQGLPQGLVSSGFFANAYLLDFDRAMGRSIGSSIPLNDDDVIEIHDYCRYVDDLRLVVSTTTPKTEASLKDCISDWAQRILDTAINASVTSSVKLELGKEKTEVEIFAAVAKTSGVAAKMKFLQQQLSGPFDFEALLQVEDGLDGLTALAELEQASDSPPQFSDSELSLAHVSRPKLEVRDDTLIRFSANRLVKVLRLRRGMTDISVDGQQGTTTQSLVHEFEVAGRRLVAAWAKNPSLVQVLRYGLDIFPSVDLLLSVTSALESQLALPRDDKQYRVACYVVAELFRAGATETGWKSSLDPVFAVGNIEAYRASLAKFAKQIVARVDIPWYVLQQAILYLATQRSSSDLVGSSHKELLLYQALSDYIRGDFIERGRAAEEIISVAVVGGTMLNDAKHFSKWFLIFSTARNPREIERALQIIGQNSPVLFRYLGSTGRGKFVSARQDLSRFLAFYPSSSDKGKSPLPKSEAIPLSDIIRHKENPFAQENGLLKLAKALSELFQDRSLDAAQVTPLSLMISCADWNGINDPHSRDQLQLSVRKVKGLEEDPRYRSPAWCDERFDWMYAIGRILRASATGEMDFTARQWLIREDVGRYTGIKSTWQKRRFGMSHSALSLSGTTAPITPWFSELLLRLLQWPGIVAEATFVREFDEISSPEEFCLLLDSRLNTQKKLYGRSSNVPVYTYPVEWNLKGGGQPHLRVALVQGLMPRATDFIDTSGKFDAPGFRARHRRHTASLIHLIHKQINAQSQVFGDSGKGYVDLIVLPEYAIDPDDQDLIRGLSDATKAMIFYGLTRSNDPLDGKRINAARWLVPLYRGKRRDWVVVDQGKFNLTQEEVDAGIESWRPYQVVMELFDKTSSTSAYRIAGTICYDATDLSLAADLRDVSHMFLVVAMNKDVKTFDSMVGALRYHMYQHVLVANSGEFGGSTAQAPYSKEHRRLLSHVHGADQVSVSLFDISIDDFGPKLMALQKSGDEQLGKTRPAGFKRNRMP